MALGGVSRVLWRYYKKRDDEGGGVKKYQILFDVIYGQPQRSVLDQQFEAWERKQLYN